MYLSFSFERSIISSAESIMLAYTFPLVSVMEIFSASRPVTLPNKRFVIALTFKGSNLSPLGIVI